MQTNKVIIGLVIALVGLIGARFGQQYLTSKSQEIPDYEQFWQELSVSQITGLALTKGESRLILEKQGDHAWKVNEFAADATKIEELIPKLIRPSSTQLISESTTQHERLGISSSSATLALQTGTEVKAVTFGGTAVGGRYVKLADSDNVYLVAGLPDDIDSLQATSWVDPVIARIDQPSISQITISKGTSNVVIKKTEQGWANAEGVEVDTTPFNALVMTLESFATQGLVDTPTNLPKAPTIQVKVDRVSGDPTTFLLYETPEMVYVSIDGKPGVYSLSSTSLKNFDIKATDLKPKS